MQEQTNEVLRRLDVLEGEWEMRAFIGEETMITGTTQFEWQHERAFMLIRADSSDDPDAPDAWGEQAPFPTVSMVGLDDRGEDFAVLYADSRGVVRIYTMGFADGRWTMYRDAPGFFQRFTGKLSEDGRRIDAAWEGSPDGEEWSLDFNLTYTKAD